MRITALQGSLLKRLPDPLHGIRPQSIRALCTRDLMRPKWGGIFILTPKGAEVLAHHEMIGKRPRGFAAMNKMRQRSLASMGGKKAHELGLAFKFQKGDPFVSACGKKGGEAAQEKHRRQQKLPFRTTETP